MGDIGVRLGKLEQPDLQGSHEDIIYANTQLLTGVELQILPRVEVGWGKG